MVYHSGRHAPQGHNNIAPGHLLPVVNMASGYDHNHHVRGQSMAHQHSCNSDPVVISMENSRVQELLNADQRHVGHSGIRNARGQSGVHQQNLESREDLSAPSACNTRAPHDTFPNTEQKQFLMNQIQRLNDIIGLNHGTGHTGTTLASSTNNKPLNVQESLPSTHLGNVRQSSIDQKDHEMQYNRDAGGQSVVHQQNVESRGNSSVSTTRSSQETFPNLRPQNNDIQQINDIKDVRHGICHTGTMLPQSTNNQEIVTGHVPQRNRSFHISRDAMQEDCPAHVTGSTSCPATNNASAQHFDANTSSSSGYAPQPQNRSAINDFNHIPTFTLSAADELSSKDNRILSTGLDSSGVVASPLARGNNINHPTTQGEDKHTSDTAEKFTYHLSPISDNENPKDLTTSENSKYTNTTEAGQNGDFPAQNRDGPIFEASRKREGSAGPLISADKRLHDLRKSSNHLRQGNGNSAGSGQTVEMKAPRRKIRDPILEKMSKGEKIHSSTLDRTDQHHDIQQEGTDFVKMDNGTANPKNRDSAAKSRKSNTRRSKKKPVKKRKSMTPETNYPTYMESSSDDNDHDHGRSMNASLDVTAASPEVEESRPLKAQQKPIKTKTVRGNLLKTMWDESGLEENNDCNELQFDIATPVNDDFPQEQETQKYRCPMDDCDFDAYSKEDLQSHLQRIHCMNKGQPENVVELHPIRKRFNAATPKQQLSAHEFKTLLKQHNLKKVRTKSNGYCFFSSLLICLAEQGTQRKQAELSVLIMSELNTHFDDVYKHAVEGMGHDRNSFLDICARYCQAGEYAEACLDIFFGAVANALGVNLNIFRYIHKGRVYSLTKHDCTRHTSNTNLLLLYTFNGVKSKNLDAHYDCLVTEEFSKKYAEKIDALMIDGGTSESGKMSADSSKRDASTSTSDLESSLSTSYDTEKVFSNTTGDR